MDISNLSCSESNSLSSFPVFWGFFFCISRDIFPSSYSSRKPSTANFQSINTKFFRTPGLSTFFTSRSKFFNNSQSNYLRHQSYHVTTLLKPCCYLPISVSTLQPEYRIHMIEPPAKSLFSFPTSLLFALGTSSLAFLPVLKPSMDALALLNLYLKCSLLGTLFSQTSMKLTYPHLLHVIAQVSLLSLYLFYLSLSHNTPGFPPCFWFFFSFT